MNQDQARELKGHVVRLRLKAAYGAEEVSGRVVGALESADGLVLVLAPSPDSDRRLSFNYQQVGEVLSRD
ncbi:MAG TPA: hypothetical protein VNI34_05515 [Candidatus Nitrosotalea sp.]|nr:hypothetical protein [Candidatus Nitrosotalea sp.]